MLTGPTQGSELRRVLRRARFVLHARKLDPTSTCRVRSALGDVSVHGAAFYVGAGMLHLYDSRLENYDATSPEVRGGGELTTPTLPPASRAAVSAPRAPPDGDPRERCVWQGCTLRAMPRT